MELSEEARVNRASYPDYYLQVRTGPGTGGDWEWYLRYRNVEILVSTLMEFAPGLSAESRYVVIPRPRWMWHV